MPLMLELKYEYFPNTWQGRIKLAELVGQPNSHLSICLSIYSIHCTTSIYYSTLQSRVAAMFGHIPSIFFAFSFVLIHHAGYSL